MAPAPARSLNAFLPRCPRTAVWEVAVRVTGSGATDPRAIMSWQCGQLTHSPKREASKLIGPSQTGHKVLRRSMVSIRVDRSWFSTRGKFTALTNNNCFITSDVKGKRFSRAWRGVGASRHRPRSADSLSAVSQVGNLLAVCNSDALPAATPCRLPVGDTAGCQPALQGRKTSPASDGSVRIARGAQAFNFAGGRNLSSS